MESIIAEQHLVKEVLHCCQGISGRYVFFQGQTDTNSRFSCGPGEISITQKQLISRITELG